MENTKKELSLRDIGYAQAGVADTLVSLAKYVMEKVEGYPADLPSEARGELVGGYQLRWHENNPPKVYAVIGDHYVLATDEHIKNKKVEKIEVGVAYAFSYSSQEFGKLKNTNPALHTLVKATRDKVTTYCSNRLGDLKHAAEALLKPDTKGTRTTLDFTASMTKIFEAQAKSVKVKQGRGDTTANGDNYKKAVAAFWATYK